MGLDVEHRNKRMLDAIPVIERVGLGKVLTWFDRFPITTARALRNRSEDSGSEGRRPKATTVARVAREYGLRSRTIITAMEEANRKSRGSGHRIMQQYVDKDTHDATLSAMDHPMTEHLLRSSNGRPEREQQASKLMQLFYLIGIDFG